ncbi:hypothetical protein EJB05_28643, partial [Eragrostis curvula]
MGLLSSDGVTTAQERGRPDSGLDSGDRTAASSSLSGRVDARRLFDEMPRGAKQEASGIDELPDGVLEHIVGFLPAEEAVRSCVLARSWRHRWKSAAALRIISTGSEFLAPVDRLREFMDHLLPARDGAPLDLCELRLGDLNTLLTDEAVLSRVDHWFRHAVGCNVQVLKLHMVTNSFHELDDPPLVSLHLTRLELFGVVLQNSFLNFSGCPNLEHLEFENCNLEWGSTSPVLFQSLKHLRITDCGLALGVDLDSRGCISAPNLVSLVLEKFFGDTPLFKSMPSLMEASVTLDNCEDRCELWHANYWDCNSESCDTSAKTPGGNNYSVLLEGLSKAKSLLLISEPTVYIFKRDMRQCPMFSNLRKLWLNDCWCVPDDFKMLACILEHSPILEKLTLQLFSEGPNHKMELEGCISSIGRSPVISEYLKMVEVKCEVVDARILKVLNFLRVFNIFPSDTLIPELALRRCSFRYHIYVPKVVKDIRYQDWKNGEMTHASAFNPRKLKVLLASSNPASGTSCSASTPPVWVCITAGTACAEQRARSLASSAVRVPCRAAAAVVAAGERGKEDAGAPAEDGHGDRISALPNALLHHVLSFLPAEEAVQTCVLARRWRDLWKSASGLRIGCLYDKDDDDPVSVDDIREFVDHLFLLRGSSPLQTCELRIGNFRVHDGERRVNLWFRHALVCKVQFLKLYMYENDYIDPWLLLDDLPLVSKHLKRLELHGVRCHTSFLDFSSCPVLEHLELEYCDLSPAKKISSESLKILRIIYSSFGGDSRTRINVPNLVSLHLDDLWGNTPVLESMPSLADAFIRITEQCDDFCDKVLSLDAYRDCHCECCDNSASTSDGGHNCVLLKGLSEAKNLALMSKDEMFIFKRDLRWCPTFSKLKTLLLNDYWCVPDDLSALSCILEHSPVLEKLTLQLFSEGPKHKLEMKGSFGSTGRSAAFSEHLQIVEVKCEGVDERVLKVLKFLCKINIQLNPLPPARPPLPLPRSAGNLICRSSRWFFSNPYLVPQLHDPGSDSLCLKDCVRGAAVLDGARDGRTPQQQLSAGEGLNAHAWRSRYVRRNKSGEEDEGAPAATGEEDRIGALPDGILHQVLSLVPAEEAVRTCVLAQRWRHLWKSAPGLRIGCLRKCEPMSVAALRRFVDPLFLLRGASPLDTCELRIGDFYGDVDQVNLWFRHAVACKVREFTLHVDLNNNYKDPWLWLDDRPLVSQHLTRLRLHCVQCCNNFLDFTSCSALEHLEFEYCHFPLVTKISSESIKSLSIIDCGVYDDSRLRIYAPNLVSLYLDDFWGMTPILENMPSLVEAFVRVTDECADCCHKYSDYGQDCNCEYCESGNIGNGSFVLLKGLSKARKLVLISDPQMFIFRRDLRWCPTFSMLKTLLLNDYWCVPDDLSALACMLEHSPVLEKLTLQLFSKGPDHKFEMRGTFSSRTWSSAISEHLKIVEIKCKAIDERVFKVLKFLCTFNITFSC